MKEGAVSSKNLEEPKSILDRFVNWQYGLDDLIDKLSKFTKAAPYQSFLSKTVTSLVHSARNAETKGVAETHAKVRENLRRIYGVTKTQQLNRILNGMNEEHDLGVFKDRNGNNVSLKITRNQAIKKWQEMQDPTLEKTLYETMGWSYEMTNAMLNILTAEDIAWAEYQMQFYREYYDSIDAVYSEMYGVHLPRNEYYSPINRDVEGNKPEFLLMTEDLFRYASVKNRSLKSRVGSREPLKFVGANETLVDHINQMEHFKAWAKSISDLRTIFNNSEIRKAVRQYHGNNILKVLDGFINDIARGGVERTKVNRIADKLRVNFTRAILGLKPSIALKQVPSFIAFSTGMPINDFISGVASFWSNPIQNYRALLEKSIYVQSRFGSGFERDIKFAMKRSPIETLSGKGNWLDYFMTLIRMGDRLAVVQGMWAKYQSGLKAGLSHEQAMFEAEVLTERTQPTSNIESLTALQNGGSFLKLMTMFQNQPNKYFRIIGNNARNFKYGRGSKAKAMTNIALAWVVLPAMFQLIADAFRFDKEHQARALLLGPLNYVLIGGQIFQSAYGWLTDMPFDYEVSPVVDSMDNLKNGLTKLKKLLGSDEIDVADVIKMIEYFAKAGGEVAGFPTPYAVQVERALRDQDYLALVFSPWSLGRTDGKSAQEKLNEAEKSLWEWKETEEIPGLEYIKERYDLSDYRSVFSSTMQSINPEDVTISNGFSTLAVSCAQSYIAEGVMHTLPNIPLYEINADQTDEYTYEDYYKQWQARQDITDPGKLKEFDKLYPHAFLGNFTRTQMELLREYHSLPEEDQKKFLEKYPELKKDMRSEWLRSHPEEQALLFLWGQTNSILTREAYDSLMKIMDELDIPNKYVEGIPPALIASDYFDYQDLLVDHKSGSYEDTYFKLTHDEFFKWGQEAGNINKEGWKDINLYGMSKETYIDYLNLKIKYRDKDAEYKALDTQKEKDDFLKKEENLQYHQDSILLDWYQLEGPTNEFYEDKGTEVPGELKDLYIEYRNTAFEHGDTSSEAKLFRLQNDVLNEWGMGEDFGPDWDSPPHTERMTPEAYEPFLELTVMWKDKIEEYEALNTDKERDAFWADISMSSQSEIDSAISDIEFAKHGHYPSPDYPEQTPDEWNQKWIDNYDYIINVLNDISNGISNIDDINKAIDILEEDIKLDSPPEGWDKFIEDKLTSGEWIIKDGNYWEGDSRVILLHKQAVDRYNRVIGVLKNSVSNEEFRQAKIMMDWYHMEVPTTEYYQEQGRDMPDNLESLYVEYRNLVFEFEAGSSQVQLFKLEHPEMFKWGRAEKTMDWKPIDTGDMDTETYIKYLKINVEYAEEDEIWDKIWTTALTTKQADRERAAFLIENPSYAIARLQREAYKKGIPNEWVDTYVKYKQLGYIKGSTAGDYWLSKHYEFYLAVRALLGWGPLETHESDTGGTGLPGYAVSGVRGGLTGMRYIPPS
ncbi:hypothetical protein ACFLXA_02935 [Chloroflexota bacterium]